MIKLKYRSEIVTKELDFSVTDDAQDSEVIMMGNEVGKSPIIWINGVLIESENIKKLKLINSNIFPEIEIEFSDPTATLMSDKYPLDNTIVSLFKKATSDGLMDIKMDFKIIDFNTNNGVSSGQLTYNLKGKLNINDMFLFKFEIFNGTSFDVLSKLTKSMDLGLATNITNTDDNMKWINDGNQKQEFFRNVLEYSYIDDSTFLMGYIDFFYNFNFIDINKQISSDISTQVNVNDSTQLGVGVENEPEPLPLILTNDDNKKTTNLFINKYTIINETTKINLNGQRKAIRYYDVKTDIFHSNKIDSLKSDTGNEIILCGNDEDEDGNYLWENSISGGDYSKQSENVHPNYVYAKEQNLFNMDYLQKLKIAIKMEKINYSLYRFQKVILELFNFAKLDDDEKDGKKSGQVGEHDSKLIQRLSGEWIIIGINFSFSTADGNTQEVTLVKRDLTKEYNFPYRKKK